MAEAEEKTGTTADEILLEDILNALDITFDDDGTQKKIKDIMQQGKARLEQLKGGAIDFAAEQTARTLLFSFCRYGRSNAIEQFEHDFSCQLTSFALEAAVANMPESGAEDEGKV
ncbi:MAG: hypothetical protein NC419_13130 [Muribaculaceae bacterium]|nr:hypothetical protein [Muribaculaceae bacterium]